jgi:transposase InsO family protein
MSLRQELVLLASGENANVSQLCRRFGVSRKTLYKWRSRGREGGIEALADRSRRPHSCPGRTSEDWEQRVLEVRQAHPAWGGRKIRAVLGRDHATGVPSPSTITRILQRHDRIDAAASAAARAYKRFEHPAPNDLWQMDFKGDFALSVGGRCYPLTILDDHSRYNLCLAACDNQRRETVWTHLQRVFARYGLPRILLADNGPPWGVGHEPGAYTRLEAWLMRLDVKVIHGRPYHPQTQGKEERFHRTLKVEVLQDRIFEDLPRTQAVFDPWRRMYNGFRPHEALALATPASRYQPSLRSYRPVLQPPQYDQADVVRHLNPVGQMQLNGRVYKLSEAFGGQPVALRPQGSVDGLWRVYYGRFEIALIDQRDRSSRMVRPR